MDQRHVLSILVDNHSGVLRRVSSLFARRGYNIESLSVGGTEDAGISRITVIVSGDDYVVDQLGKQVSKLVEVKRVELLSPADSVYRELLLIKVKTTRTTRAEILEIANIFRAHIIDVSGGSLVLEVTGDTSKNAALIRMLEPFTILEIVRTGLAAIGRGERVLKADR